MSGRSTHEHKGIHDSGLWRGLTKLGRATLQVLPRETSRLPLLLGMFCTALWIWGCAPDITWFDTGELAGAGFELGLSHPPGQPLHALACKAFSFIPLGPIGFRCNLLSAVCAGLSVVFVGRIAKTLWPARGVETGLVAAVCVAIGWALTEQAVRTEVYSLAFLLIAASYWALAPLFSAKRLLPAGASHRVLRFHRLDGSRRSHSTLDPATLPSGIDFSARIPIRRPLVLAGLSLSLAAAAHPLLAASTGSVIAICSLFLVWKRHRWQAAALGLAAALLGCLVWLYLPLSAHRETIVKLGDPSSLSGFWEMMTARAYAANVEGPGQSLFTMLWSRASLLAHLGGLFVLVAAAVGLVMTAASSRDRVSLILPTGLFLSGLAPSFAMSRFLPLNPDLHGYLLPALGGMALLATWTVIELPRKLFRSRKARSATRAVLTMALLVPTGLVHADRLLAQTSHGPEAYELTAQVSSAISTGPSVMVAQNDHFFFPLLYAKATEGWRPDVAVAGSWLVGSTAHWYRRHLKTLYPWLFVPFLDDGGNTTDMRRRFVVENLTTRPVYVETPGQEHGNKRLEDCGSMFAVRPAKRVSSTRRCRRFAEYPRIDQPRVGRLIDCFVSMYRAEFLAGRGKWEEALRQLAPHLSTPPPKRWSNADPFLCTTSQPLVLAAKIHIHARRWAQAAIHLNCALRAEPRRAENHLQMGRLLALQGRLDAAKPYFERAVSLEEKNVKALFYLALTSGRLGDTERADKLFERARTIDAALLQELIDAHSRGPK